MRQSYDLYVEVEIKEEIVIVKCRPLHNCQQLSTSYSFEKPIINSTFGA